MENNKNGGITLLIIIHCHQPIGNFDWVFKEAYDKAYLPFIQVLERHPRIKVAFHYSGCLLDWIKEKRPEFLEILKRLVKNGQIEMVAGGYYEPILPLIPDRDKFAQIKMHLDFIKQHTGYQAKGIWLTERVWEPYLAKIFSQANLTYTIVDDAHFELVGKKVEEMLGYYLTEEEGYSIAIFPSSKELRYNIPFKLPMETINYLRSQATQDGTRAVTFGDDGEKFGLWPGTYKWVYEERWLENFFKALEDNSEWIRIFLPSDYIKNYGPLGRIYIPCASYPEMLEWSGGYFRNFLVKYHEANWMHKRMCYVSEKVNAFTIRDQKFKEARQFLYKAQCNCAYWHGVFGGLYLHHLRHAVYNSLIEAEKIIGESEKTKASLKAEVLDIDRDGMEEIILENGPLAIFVDPAEGGSILEIDYRPKSIDLVNTLTRRQEAYHAKLSDVMDSTSSSQSQNLGVVSIHDIVRCKEKNLNELLSYDWYRKSFLIEHFLASDSDFKNFSKATFRELGDFIASPYKYDVKKETGNITVLLERKGLVLVDEKPLMLKLDKVLRIESQKAILNITYRLKNMLDTEAKLWFGSEFNLSLRDPEFCECGELLDINRLEIEDEWFKVFLDYSLSKNSNVWFYPVETVSDSEGGLERTYQQLCLLFHWRIALKPRQVWSVDISFKIS
ncbi:MAG: DUF1926 domain-containing protein [Candidatus Omnitrophica bacterium]|nr:DUF1926 domain-containing protein [Candidatus Omnitrophota bacterium]